jgi:hypothetical protein
MQALSSEMTTAVVEGDVNGITNLPTGMKRIAATLEAATRGR